MTDREFCQQVATALGSDWRLTRISPNGLPAIRIARTQDPDHVLWLTISLDEKTIQVWGLYPAGPAQPPGTPAPADVVSRPEEEVCRLLYFPLAGQTAVGVAERILTEYLPQYEDMVGRCQEEIARRNREIGQNRDTLFAINNATGAEIRLQKATRTGRPDTLRIHAGNLQGYVALDTLGSVVVHLAGVSEAQAIRLLALVSPTVGQKE